MVPDTPGRPSADLAPFHATLDDGPFYLLEVRPDGSLARSNRRWRADFGDAPSLLSLAAPGHGARLQASLATVFAGMSGKVGTTLARPGGAAARVDWSATLSPEGNALLTASADPHHTDNQIVFDAMEQAVMVLSYADLLVVEANAAARRIYGLAPDADLKMTPLAALSGDTTERWAAVEAEIRAATQVAGVLHKRGWHGRRADQGSFHCAMTATRVTLAGADCLLVTQTEGQDQIEELIDSIDEVLWTRVLPSGKLTYVSKSCAQLLGHPRESFLRDEALWRKCLHPIDRDFTVQQFEIALTRPKYEFEYRVITPGGERKWVRESTRVVRDADGRPRILYGIMSDITERKEYMLNLSASERRFQQALDLSIEAMAIGNSKGHIVEANRKLEELTGLGRDQLIGRKLQWIFPAEEMMGSPLRYDLVEQGQEVVRERRLVRPDGTEIYIEMHTKKMDNGFLMMNATDITRRKHSQMETQRLMQVQEFIIKLGADYILAHPRDLDSVVRLSLEHMARLTGSDRAYIFDLTSDMRYMNNTYEWCSSIVQPEIENNQRMGTDQLTPVLDAFEEKGYYMQAVAGLDPGSEIHQTLSRQNIKSLVLVPIRYENFYYGYAGFDSVDREREWTPDEIAVLRLFAGVMSNLLLKQEYENRLRDTISRLARSEQKTRTLISASPIGFLQLSPQGEILEANQAAVALLGAPGYEATMGVNLFELDNVNGTPLHASLLDAIQRQAPVSAEMPYTSLWGKTHYYRYHIRPIIAEGRTDSVLINFENITEAHENQRRLTAMKEKAEESDRLKSSFLANMSHEIRTPMNGIVGFAELLNDDTISPERKRKYTSIIISNAYHLLDLINDIIDISKIESNQIKPTYKPAFLNQILRDIRDTMLPQAEDRGIALNLSLGLPDDRSHAMTDGLKLRQILTNLTANAIKFTRRGGVSVSYRAQGADLVFEVADTGTGMTARDIEHIFDRFHQLDNQPEQSRTGTGLGLTISKAYAEMLGGGIEVESEPGKGSLFRVTLPHTPIAVCLEADDAPAAAAGFEWEGRSILVAEDDYVSAIFLRQTLEKTRARVVVAGTGYEAIRAVKTDPGIDLVLMDVRLPGLDGLQAMAEIHKIDPSLPVVIQSAFAFNENAAKAAEAGCADYLTKPLKASVLLEAVARHIDKKGKGRPQA